MNDMTLGIIYALKQPEGQNAMQSVIQFMSNYTGTEKKYYSGVKITQIIRDAFIDYLKTADNPAFDVWQYFDAKRQQENLRSVFPEQAKQYAERDGSFDDDTEGIISALRLSRVRENGKYVNGFREMEKIA